MQRFTPTPTSANPLNPSAIAAQTDSLQLTRQLMLGTAPKPRSPWQRGLSALLVLTLWIGPLQLVWQDARNSASQLGSSITWQVAQREAIDWQLFTVELNNSVKTAQREGNWLAPLSLLERKLPGVMQSMAARWTEKLPSLQFGQPAMAAAIADPAAPIRFQPQITQTTGVGGGVPVVNITAPNAAGISLNQYSQFNVDAIGLILNNSLVGGGSTLGGTVAANGNLSNRTASQIINQVTTQGSPSTIAGTIEVFGTQADVIIANPNGISCTACGFINTPRIVMTTGTPQFLTERGGAASSFDDAKALAYDVQGGHIQIEGTASANGTPGAGIESSAGVVDLIAGSIGVNASINAGQQINLISGQQTVSEAVAGQGKAGSDYSVAANGSTANFSGPDPTLQIDATAFGAMNAGQIKIIGTTAGLGVKAGVVNATSGNVTIDANGDVNVDNAYGSQGVTINAAGAVQAASVTSYGAATVTANGDATVGQLTAANDAQISGNNVTLGTTIVGGALSVNGSGNVTTTQNGSVVGDTQFTAGNVFGNAGIWTAGGNLNINAATVNNALSAQLAGLSSTTVTANSLTNNGTIYGDNLQLNVTGAVDNTLGSLLAKSALVANVGSLVSNLGGTIYVGDPNAAATAAPAGDLSLNATGTGVSINNLGGLIAASNNLGLSAVNGVFDPSSTLGGQINLNGALSINVGTLIINGSWLASGSSVSLSAVNGMVNNGIIQSAGDLTLSSSAGAVVNNGAVVAGRDLITNGIVNNSSGAVLHAERDVNINGSGSNAGTIEAVRNINLQGSDFDNSNGVIQANNNISANLSGTLTNVAGTIVAQNDVTIQAATINNDRAAPVTVTSTSQQVVDAALLSQVYLGNFEDFFLILDNPSPIIPVYLTTDLSVANGASNTGSTYTLNGVSSTIDWTLGTIKIQFTVCNIRYLCNSVSTTYNLPTVDRVLLMQKEGTQGQILAGGNAYLTTTTLSNRGSTISAGNNLVANISTLNNGPSDTVVTYRAGDTVNQASLDTFIQEDPMDFLTDSVGGIGTINQHNLVTAPSNVVETDVQGTRGMLSAGANVTLNGSGNITNAGDLVAGNNISITLPGDFVNQGTYQSSFTTKPGCLPSVTCREDNAHVDTFAYQQTANNVVAGGTLTVTAATVANDFGTLSARGNVNLSANSVDNLAGTILSSAGDVNIAASTITNRVVDPVTTHTSYGNENPQFALGCNAGGTYKGSECSTDTQNQASAAAIISGAQNVNITGDTLTNTGSLITAGSDANIDISGAVTNTSVALDTTWQGHWTEETCWFCSDKEHYTNGVVADGNQAAGIQAGSALTLASGGTVINTGNVLGVDVALSGTDLINGITDSNQPTASTTVTPQLVSIGLNGTAVTADGTPSTSAPVYAVSVPGGDALSSFGPNLLVSNLPPNLQPDTNLFYYDATTENNLIRQAAVTQTGSGTFVNGVAWSSTDNLSVDDQQKAILYNNAIDFAEANNVQLGTALTPQQISSLDKPMLWYTEQAVPDPACSFASTVCGTINALMPQVYLPPNYASNTAGGVISGNDVALNFSDSITNTGIIQATNLAVQTASLTNEQRSVDIGTSDYKVQGGWMEYTGTQLQPGGFMSAVNLDVQAQRITSIGDAFHVLNADGSPDAAGTAALLTSLRDQLGSDFTEITPSDDIHTNFIKDTSGPGALGMVIIIAAAIALSIVTAGAAAAALSSTFAVGGVASTAVSAAIGAMASSAFTQLATTGTLNVGDVLEAGAVSGLTAGLTQGLLGSTGMSTTANGVVQANPATTLANLPSTALRIGEQSLIAAAVQTTIEGGSFGTALLHDAVSGAAAVGANAIGNFDFSSDGGEAAYLAAHGLLGCAASAAEGTGCASGAIGGIASAALAPLVRDGLYDDTETVSTVTNADGSVTTTTSYNNTNYNAVTAAIAALAGGTTAGLMGQDASAGATWAENEAINNALHTEYKIGPADSSNTTNGQATDSSTLDKVAGQHGNMFDNGGVTTANSAPSSTTSQSGDSSSAGENQTTNGAAATGTTSSALAALVSSAADQAYYFSQGSFQTIAGLASGAFAGTFGYAGGALGGVLSSILDGTYGTQQGVQQAAQSAFDTASMYTYSPSNPWAQSNLAGINATLADSLGPLMSIQPLLSEYAAYLGSTSVAGDGSLVNVDGGKPLNYGNQNSGYGSTTLTDVNGNPIPTGAPTTTTVGENSGAQGVSAITDLSPVSPTASGNISATAINNSGYSLISLTPEEQSLALKVMTQGDQTGAVTEGLVESVAQGEGLTSLSGGKYGSNNGFDHVFQNPDGTITILLDSKQITNGSTSLSTTVNGAQQMSDAWVQDVLNKLDPNSPAFKAVDNAVNTGTLIKGVIGVDRTSGNLIMVRVP